MILKRISFVWNQPCIFYNKIC